MATLTSVNPKDLEFLLQLNQKLHSTSKATITPNMSGRPFEVTVDNYTNASMNAKEIWKLLKILERSDFAFYPINTAAGFAVGFQVANPETREELLTFKEAQLPRNYNFKKLSKYFMSPKNLQRAKSLEVEVINDRSHYDY